MTLVPSSSSGRSRVPSAKPSTTSHRSTGAPDIELDGYLFGATVPIGPGLIRTSYSHVKYDFNLPLSFAPDPKASKFALGYIHNLSKRTALMRRSHACATRTVQA